MVYICFALLSQRKRYKHAMILFRVVNVFSGDQQARSLHDHAKGCFAGPTSDRCSVFMLQESGDMTESSLDMVVRQSLCSTRRLRLPRRLC